MVKALFPKCPFCGIECEYIAIAEKTNQKDVMTQDEMDLSELKSELARKYYEEDAMCLSDLTNMLDEYDQLRKAQA